MGTRVALSILIAAMLTACAGPPKRIAAERFCELYSTTPGTLFNSAWIGSTPGPNGRAYLEVWTPGPFGPDLVIYFTPVHEFDDTRFDGCPFGMLHPEVLVAPM